MAKLCKSPVRSSYRKGSIIFLLLVTTILHYEALMKQTLAVYQAMMVGYIVQLMRYYDKCLICRITTAALSAEMEANAGIG